MGPTQNPAGIPSEKQDGTGSAAPSVSEGPPVLGWKAAPLLEDTARLLFGLPFEDAFLPEAPEWLARGLAAPRPAESVGQDREASGPYPLLPQVSASAKPETSPTKTGLGEQITRPDADLDAPAPPRWSNETPAAARPKVSTRKRKLEETTRVGGAAHGRPSAITRWFSRTAAWGKTRVFRRRPEWPASEASGTDSDRTPAVIRWTDEKPTAARPKISTRRRMVRDPGDSAKPDLSPKPATPRWTDERPTAARPKISTRKTRLEDDTARSGWGSAVARWIGRRLGFATLHGRGSEKEWRTETTRTRSGQATPITRWTDESPTAARPKMRAQGSSTTRSMAPATPVTTRKTTARWSDERPTAARPKIGGSKKTQTAVESEGRGSTAVWSRPWVRVAAAVIGALSGSIAIMNSTGEGSASAGEITSPVAGVPSRPLVPSLLVTTVEQDVGGSLLSRSAFLPPPGARTARRDLSRRGIDFLHLVPDPDPATESLLRSAAAVDDPGRMEAWKHLRSAGPRAQQYLAAVLSDGLKHPGADAVLLETAMAILTNHPESLDSHLILQAALSGPPAVRQMALGTLAELGAPEAVPLAVQGLRDPSPEVRARATRVLRAAGEAARPALLRAIRHAGRLDEGMVEQMVALLEGPPGPGAYWPLADLLDHESPRVRKAAVRALASWKGTPSSQRRGLAGLVRDVLLDVDPEVRGQAVLTLLAFGDQDDLGTLAEMLEDPDEGVRAAARRALVGLSGTDVGGSYYAWQRYLESRDELRTHSR